MPGTLAGNSAGAIPAQNELNSLPPPPLYSAPNLRKLASKRDRAASPNRSSSSSTPKHNTTSKRPPASPCLSKSSADKQCRPLLIESSKLNCPTP